MNTAKNKFNVRRRELLYKYLDVKEMQIKIIL